MIPDGELYQSFCLLPNQHGTCLEIRLMTGDTLQGTVWMEKLIGVLQFHAPMPEQKWIVAILDEAFEDIATVKVNAEKNLQNARAIFESHLQSVFTQREGGWNETTLGTKLIVSARLSYYEESADTRDSCQYVLNWSIKILHDTAMAASTPGVVIGREGNHRRRSLLPYGLLVARSTTLWRRATVKRQLSHGVHDTICGTYIYPCSPVVHRESRFSIRTYFSRKL